jgi:pimeloyl-ACP methyl ester carboxylesterase
VVDAEFIPLLHTLHRLAERHDVAVPGTDARIAWRRLGVGGPPVVLLHGGHGSWLHWARNVQALAARHTVWVPDLPGYGDSTGGADLTLESIVALLKTSLDCLIGANARVHVVGFSFGGLVAAALAAERGGVCSLALLGPAGHGGPRRPQGELRPWQPAHARGDAQALDDALRHNLGVQMLHGAHSGDAAALCIHREACLRTRFRSKPLSRAGALPALLTRYAGRVLLAWGEHDVTAVPETTRPLLAQRTDSSRFVVLPGAGHWVQYEAAADINALLLQWLHPFPHPQET